MSIELKNLSKSFDGKKILDSFSYEFPQKGKGGRAKTGGENRYFFSRNSASSLGFSVKIRERITPPTVQTIA